VFLAVHLTTLRPHADRTCIIRTGEHPFVQHDTCAVFGSARRITEESLRDAGCARQAFRREPVSEQLLDCLRKGRLKSPYTPNVILAMLRDEFGVSDERGNE
jgi:hypothetical protein